MPELFALAAPPGATARWLRRLWDDGTAVLPLAPDLPDEELEGMLAHLRPARLGRLTSDGQMETQRLEGARPVPDDTALVVATSGSTGQPRGVRLTHDAVATSTEASVARLGCRPGEPWLSCLPTHHVAGLQALLRSWAAGAEPVVHDAFDVDDVASAPAAHVSLVPTQLRRLLDAGADVSRFETILLGGARAPRELLDRASSLGARVVVSYGMTETCGGCVYDGWPLDPVEIAIDPEGLVRIRGPVLFAGYHGPHGELAAVDAEGWFTSSDVGRMMDGRLEVLGRADDVVISGGENVSLEGVRETLLTHPEIMDAAATGREDPDWGEVVVAAVVARDPSRPPSLTQLREHVRRSRPAAFAPREVAVVDRIPRGPLGKVSRALLEELIDQR